MSTYLELLPDELHRKVYSYLYNDVMHELEYGGQVPVYPVAFYYCFMRENSDYIRHKYLKTLYARITRPFRTVREIDWMRFMLDLERPTIWTCLLEPWNSYNIRRDGGGIRWHTTYDCPKLSLGGWLRLTEHL